MTEKDQMDYAMKHFLFIADQRLKTFNFYAILLAASVGATVGALREGFSLSLFLIGGCFHIFIASVFFIIERRNTQLLTIAKSALERIEAKAEWPEEVRLAHADSLALKSWFARMFSYRVAFYLAYLAQGLFGLGFVVCALFVRHP